MLRWMCINHELRAYFIEGEVTGKASLFSVVSEIEGFDYSGSMAERDALIRKRWNSDMASRLVGRRMDEVVFDEPSTWSKDEEPREVSAGVMLWADEIDWESGLLTGEFLEDVISGSSALFWDSDELFVSSFGKADFDVNLKGMSLSVEAVEMLLPSGDMLTPPVTQAQSSARIGRPPKWDWEGAITAMVAAAQHPDGLATGPGAQADLERRIAAWFIEQTGDAPSNSLIRGRASRVLATLKGH